MSNKFLITTLQIYTIFHFQHCQSANILCLFPTPSISHQLIPRALVKSLASRGHNITMFTTDPFETNLTNVELHSWKPAYKVFNDHFNMTRIKETDVNTLGIINAFARTILETTILEMKHPAIEKLIVNAENRTFDVVIIECLGITPFYAFAKYFNAPLIGLTTLDAPRISHSAVGNFIHPILHPNPILPFSENLTFCQRLKAVFMDIFLRSFITDKVKHEFDNLISQYFGPNMTKSSGLLQDMDFLMFNAHPVLGAVRPIVPASLALGFVHIESTQPLPSDLQEFFNRSKNGVIYFSLGSNVKSSQLSNERVRIFCEVFRTMKYDILWKWETEALANKPDNVKIVKWLPQQDVLANEKIKLFITQGGQQSFEEAIHHSVPLLVIPFLGDQYVNAQRIVKMNIGLSLDINTLTTGLLERTLNQLLSNSSSFKGNMKKLSVMAKDVPMTSLESAVWWTEYVIRHKGAKHLHAKGKDLPLYQYYMLDIAALICISVYLFIKIIKFFVIFLKCGVAVFYKYLKNTKIKLKSN